MFSIAAVLFLHSCQGFRFLHILADSCYFFFFTIVAILMGLKWYLIVVSVCTSLMINDIVLKTAAHFNWVVHFVVVELGEFFIYYGCKFLIRYIICKYYLPFCGLPFYSVNCVLWETEILNFIVVEFIFSFLACAFGVISKESLWNPTSLSFCSMFFFFNNFIYVLMTVLGLCCSTVSRSYSPVVHRLLIAAASLVEERRLWNAWSSVVETCGLSSCDSLGSRTQAQWLVVHGFSCSTACGLFSDQGSNRCLLHWQADSLLLSPKGSPCPMFFSLKIL